MYVATESRLLKRPQIDDARYHLILLVRNELGYRNLVKLVTKANLEGFYYKPRIDTDLLRKYADGLICLSGCQRGEIARAVVNKTAAEAQKAALPRAAIAQKRKEVLMIIYSLS